MVYTCHELLPVSPLQPPAPSLPPPPPTATDEYSSLQHDLGGGGGGGPHQVVDQDQHMYDSAQGDLPQYSSIAQQVGTGMLHVMK